MHFTVLGASGFIGSHLASHLRQQGYECLTPERNAPSLFRENLGHVIYCIGLTADFRQRPFDTVRAHVCVLADILEKARYESFLYLSSTRIYGKAESTNEDIMLTVNPQDFSDLYNLTKLTGESLCFATGNAKVRVARLSNVYGSDIGSKNFLPSIISDAIERRHIKLQTTRESSKDYIDVNNVVNLLPRISLGGQYRVYNVASGRNVSNGELMEQLKIITSCSIEVADGAQTILYPVISVDRIKHEFGFEPVRLIDVLNEVVRKHAVAEG